MSIFFIKKAKKNNFFQLFSGESTILTIANPRLATFLCFLYNASVFF